MNRTHIRPWISWIVEMTAKDLDYSINLVDKAVAKFEDWLQFCFCFFFFFWPPRDVWSSYDLCYSCSNAGAHFNPLCQAGIVPAFWHCRDIGDPTVGEMLSKQHCIHQRNHSWRAWVHCCLILRKCQTSQPSVATTLISQQPSTLRQDTSCPFLEKGVIHWRLRGWSAFFNYEVFLN